MGPRLESRQRAALYERQHGPELRRHGAAAAADVESRTGRSASQRRSGIRSAAIEDGDLQMSANDHYLAMFLGSKTDPRRAQWEALPEAERRAKEREGIAAWKAWVEKHQASIVAMGGPLGRTKRITPRGIEDTSNPLAGFTIVRAGSHEAAARLFESHPHFTIFPGDAVEIMPVLPIPGG
jgi:hypothetical protein